MRWLNNVSHELRFEASFQLYAAPPSANSHARSCLIEYLVPASANSRALPTYAHSTAPPRNSCGCDFLAPNTLHLTAPI